jgi:uncharacterized protein (TIGR03000 family)
MSRLRLIRAALTMLTTYPVGVAMAAPPGFSAGPNPIFGSPGAFGPGQYSYPAPGVYGSTVFMPYALAPLSGSWPAYNVPQPPANWRDELMAHVTIRLPADARLWVNGKPTKQTGEVRQFVTPPVLRAGQTYQYTFRAEWLANGQTVVRERPVSVRAAEATDVDFTKP